MRENRLRFFEDLIHWDSEAAQAEKNKKPHENFNVSVIDQEKRSVLQYLRELKFFIVEEKQLVWIINTYFERVIDLINQAHALAEKYSLIPSTTKKILPYHSVMAALQEILSLLEVQYSKYMDLGTCLPVTYEAKLKNSLVAAFLQFKESVQASPDLLQVIESVYADFAAALECGKTTYYRAYYLATLIKNLQKLITATDTTILRTLIAFNFNSLEFTAYHTLKLRESPEKLAFALKEINQINVIPGLALNPLLPSAKEQFSTWLAQEIAFLGNTSANEYPSPAAPAGKIMTTLSVPQLANMLKLFSDMGVIVHSNKTELLESFANMFRTEKVENISPASLRNNFYNEDSSVSRSVRNLLLTIINKSKGIT